MVLGFLRSKSAKLKNLLEEDKLSDIQKILDEDSSVADELKKFLKSDNITLKSNSIYILTKYYLKHNKDISELFPSLKSYLTSKNENLVLNSIMSVKLITDIFPDTYSIFESEITLINRNFINLDIREYSGTLIKKYGTFKTYNLQENQRVLQKHVKKLMNSSKQESLFGKLMEIGSSLFFVMPEKLEITEKMLEDCLSKQDLKFNLFALDNIKNGTIKEMDPLNIVYQLSKIPTLGENEVDEVLDQTLDLMVSSKNMVVRNMVLNTIYEISETYPQLLFKHISGLEKYAEQYGGNDPIFKAIILEIGRKYDIKHTKLSRFI
ncbi:conserved hypothetical protein [Methanococcus vannielii SB]|uniref:HEAT domain containing protein n=1 Tax=Methanococcus vannielii (strain ATCC 35089 / DSM 1224 / JCM 13029 / OCM 148 / SB) TaxID=406327 RepID=A6UN80_METVS|nr:hypothetical protein [Methanococcus vannielii]ABR53952.1 conserved hypothetical protein [Methanococcus vannielii SB]